VEKAVFGKMSLRLEAETLKKRTYGKIHASSHSKNIRLMLVWNENNR
jgi:hypothetical protein